MGKPDAPHHLLDYFRANYSPPNDLRWAVRWATQQELRDEPPRKKHKLIPYGAVAGGRDVYGHGRLVCLSGRDLLTCDILAAIRAGYQWPWDAAKPYVVPGGILNDAHAMPVEFVHRTWYLNDEGEITWRGQPHSSIPPGTPAGGTLIAGRNERIITSKGVAYLKRDIEHVLRHDEWSWWPPKIDWD